MKKSLVSIGSLAGACLLVVRAHGDGAAAPEDLGTLTTLDAPIIRTVQLGSRAGGQRNLCDDKIVPKPEPGKDCQQLWTHDDPDFVFELDRPRPDLVVYMRNPYGGGTVVEAPDSNGERRLLTGSDAAVWSKSGKYKVWLGYGGGGVLPTSFVVMGKESNRDPLASVQSLFTEIEMEHRFITTAQPTLEYDDLLRSDDVRLKIFWAPKQLYVFANDDLAGNAKLLERVNTTTTETADTGWDKQTIEYPKKDEPLLRITEDQVLTIDGLIFEVAARHLADHPSGKISLPAKIRDNYLSWGYARLSKEKEDVPVLAKLEKVTARFEACSEKVRNANPLAADPDALAEQKCNGAAFTRASNEAHQQILKHRAAHRTKIMEMVRKYLEGEFP